MSAIAHFMFLPLPRWATSARAHQRCEGLRPLLSVAGGYTSSDVRSSRGRSGLHPLVAHESEVTP